MTQPVEAENRQRVAAFAAMLADLESYAQLLHDTAIVCRTLRFDPERPPAPVTEPSLISWIASVSEVLATGRGVIAEETAERLESCANSFRRIRDNIRSALREGDVVGALVWTVQLGRNLNGFLETYSWGERPILSVVPPTWVHFAAAQTQLDGLFPHEPGGPLWSEPMLAFKSFLLTDRNPWAA